MLKLEKDALKKHIKQAPPKNGARGIGQKQGSSNPMQNGPSLGNAMDRRKKYLSKKVYY